MTALRIRAGNSFDVPSRKARIEVMSTVVRARESSDRTDMLLRELVYLVGETFILNRNMLRGSYSSLTACRRA